MVRSAKLSDDGQFAVTTSSDHTAKVWATSDGRLISLLAGHADVVTDAVSSTMRVASSRAVSTAPRGCGKAAPARSSRPSGRRPPRPTRQAESSDGARAEAVGDVIRLRTAVGKTITLRGHRDEVNSVAFDGDGSLLVSSSRDHDARIWDARTGRLLHQLEGHFGSVADAQFSPDGRWVVTAGPITAGLWNVRTGELVMYLRGPTTRPAAVAFAPDSRTDRRRGGERRRASLRVCGVRDCRRVARRRGSAHGTHRSDAHRRRTRALPRVRRAGVGSPSAASFRAGRREPQQSRRQGRMARGP